MTKQEFEKLSKPELVTLAKELAGKLNTIKYTAKDIPGKIFMAQHTKAVGRKRDEYNAEIVADIEYIMGRCEANGVEDLPF